MYSIDEAFTHVGFGKYQCLVLVYAGLGLFAEAMEMMILSFIGQAVKSEWKLSSTKQTLLTSVIFAGLLLGSFFWGFVSDRYGRRHVSFFFFLYAVYVSFTIVIFHLSYTKVDCFLMC